MFWEDDGYGQFLGGALHRQRYVVCLLLSRGSFCNDF